MFETQHHEAGITSNRMSLCYGEIILLTYTHCPSHAGS